MVRWHLLNVILVFSLCVAHARADHYSRGDTGNFSDAKWIDLSKQPPTPDSGPPGGGDIADMTGGAGATITASGGSVMEVEGSSNFVVTGAFSAQSLNYTGVIMGAGTLTVGKVLGASPFVLTITGGNVVANTMAEDFILNGGSLHVTTGFSGKMASVSNGGTATLDNAQTALTFDVESGGQLTVKQITDSHSESTSLSGSGTMVTVKENLSEFGCSLGVTTGAALEVGENLEIAGMDNVGGGAHFSDAGTTVRVEKLLSIGGISGPSALYVSSGAFAYGAKTLIGDGSSDNSITGFVDLSGSDTILQGDTVGIAGNGSVQMSDGGELAISDNGLLGVGVLGPGTGMLTADGSNTVIDARKASVSVAVSSGLHGNVILTNGARFLVGSDTNIADGGSGEVDVRSGSQFFAYQTAGSASELILGNGSKALGGIVVTGQGSAASFGMPVVMGNAAGSDGGISFDTQATGSFATDVVVGASGIATFYMDTGAQVTMQGGTPEGLIHFIVGENKSGNGTMTVTGTGTSFSAASGSEIDVGENGKGAFIASNGASVQTDLVFVGQKGANGSVLIDTNASWTLLAGSVFYIGVDQGTGKLTVQNSATLSIPDKLVLFSSGQVVLDQTGRIALGSSGFGGGGTLRVGNDGQLTGNGTVSGKLLLDTGGLISPNIDNKPGILTVNGDFQAQTGGELDIHVGGNSPGSQFDQLKVTGNATLGGTLDVTPLNNFTPPAGKAFPVISAASVSGTFDQVIGADATYTATGVMVTPKLQSSTLTVDVNPAGPPAGGSVSTGFLGQSTRTVGFTYKVTATPAKGFVFNGWSGDVTSANPALTFTMKASMTLHANFVSNAFAPVVGAFAGLGTSGSNALSLPPDALLNLSLASSGKFTAKFLLGGKSLAFIGTFLGDGTFSSQYTVAGKTLDVQLTVNLAGSDKLAGTIAVDGVSYAINANRATFNTKNPATAYAGAYTIYFRPNADNSDPDAPRPQGNCWATASISTGGAVTIKGALADNTPLNAGGFLAKDGSFGLLANLYKNLGFFSGTLHFAAAPRDPSMSVSDVAGSVEWSKPADGAAVFPGSFDTMLSGTGSFFSAPHNARIVPGLDSNGDAQLQFSGAGLPLNFPAKPITITLQNAVHYSSMSPADKLTMTFTTTTGAFSGKFYNGATLVPFSGVVLQKQQIGEGFFLGATDSGQVDLSH